MQMQGSIFIDQNLLANDVKRVLEIATRYRRKRDQVFLFCNSWSLIHREPSDWTD